MKLSDIYNCKWNIAKDCKIIYNDSNSLEKEEQECIFNIDKINDNIKICCSYQSYITKLSKSSFVYVTRLLVSRNNDNFILEMQAYSSKKIITIRKAITSMSKEQKKVSLQALNDYRAKKRNGALQ